MKKRILCCSFAVSLLALAHGSLAQTTTVYFNSGTTTGKDVLYSNKMLTTVLTAGNANTAGDGAVLRWGYYQNATTSNLFGNGTFVPLSGQGSTNTYTSTTIGDDPGAANGGGTFAMQLNFSTATGSSIGNNLPAAGTPLAIQFFNGTTLANSTADNAVSDRLWTWVAPQTPPSVVLMSLDDYAQSPLQWLGGDSSAFYTSQPFTNAVPEPSETVLLALGGLAVIVLKKRRSQRVHGKEASDPRFRMRSANRAICGRH